MHDDEASELPGVAVAMKLSAVLSVQPRTWYEHAA